MQMIANDETTAVSGASTVALMPGSSISRCLKYELKIQSSVPTREEQTDGEMRLIVFSN